MKPKIAKRIIAKYYAKHPKTPGKRPQAPKLQQLIDEHRQEQQLIRGGVYEYLNIEGFCHHRQKPKNGGFARQDSIVEFHELFKDPLWMPEHRGQQKNRVYALLGK